MSLRSIDYLHTFLASCVWAMRTFTRKALDIHWWAQAIVARVFVCSAPNTFADTTSFVSESFWINWVHLLTQLCHSYFSKNCLERSLHQAETFQLFNCADATIWLETIFTQSEHVVTHSARKLCVDIVFRFGSKHPFSKTRKGIFSPLRENAHVLGCPPSSDHRN